MDRRKWLWLAPIVLLAKLITIVSSPFVAALSVLLGWEDLRGPFRWMGTHDDTVDGLKNGYPPTEPYTFWRWANRVTFMCRNPAYRFMYYTLGVDIETRYIFRSRPYWNTGEQLEWAWSLEDPTIWQVRGRWGPLYVWFGWKLHTPHRGRAMYALDVNLWKTRKP